MKRVILFLACMAFFFVSLASASIYIVTNSANRIESISKKDVKRIFLGEKKFWNDNSKIKIADNLDRDTAKEFYTLFIGKDASWIKKIWIKKMLRGEMNPPESFKDIEELFEFIAGEKQCIGFVSDAKVPQGVKVLKLVD